MPEERLHVQRCQVVIGGVDPGLCRLWSLEGYRIETLTITDKVTPMSVGSGACRS